MPLDTLTDSSTAAGPDGSLAQVAYLRLRERLVMLDIAPERRSTSSRLPPTSG